MGECTVGINYNDKPFQELLSGRAFDVPDFQREYSWTKKNLEDMFYDATSSSDAGHFLGTIILYKNSPNEPSLYRDEIVHIVDGQQRLTTLMIILSAIRSKFESLELDRTTTISDIDSYLNIYHDRERKNHSRSRLITQEDYFQKGIARRHIDQGSIKINTDSSKRMNDAYKNSLSLIEDKISSSNAQNTEDKGNILDSILTSILSVKFMVITLDSLAEAYTIFQTVNARGVPLETIDLVKSDLFSYAAQKEDADPTNHWKDAQENWVFTKTGGDEYFQAYWYSRFGYVRRKDIFQNYKDKLKISDPTKALNVIKEIKEYSKYYKAIYSPSYLYGNSKRDPSIIDICESIYSISSIFQNTQVNPLLLSLIKKNQSKDIKNAEFRDFLKILENYLFHSEVTGVGKGGGRTQMYARMAGRITKARNKKEILTELEEIKKDFAKKISDGGEQEFIKGFMNLEYRREESGKDSNEVSSDGAFIRYVLYKIAKHFNLTVEPGLDWRREGNATIEHLVPIATVKDKAAVDRDGETWTLEIICKIPNLILLSKEMNDELDNLSSDTKLSILKKYKFNIYPYLEGVYSARRNVVVKDISDYNLEIAKEAYHNIWNISS